MRAATLLVLLLLLAAPAHARMAAPDAPIAGNPANALAGLPIENSAYDDAKRCLRRRRPGVEAFTGWLQRTARGVSWGTYRCELWGKKQASLHAEGRALDWHLDRRRPADSREARRLISLLLAPDPAGNEQALARRMGVQEIIWDCGYWRAGMREFSPYAPCHSKRGRLRRRVNPTVAHRDHLHIGFTRSGAAGRTSFWAR